jgi:hypothetical protein
MTRRIWIAGAAVVLMSGVAWGAIASANDAPKSPSISSVSGPNPYDSMPDRIGIVDRHTGQPVGTVSKTDLMASSRGAGGDRPSLEVLDANGKFVGHMVPGVGFVSLAESSAPGYDVAKLQSETNNQNPTTTVVLAPGAAP